MIAYAFPIQQKIAVSGGISPLTVGATVLGSPLGGALVTKASWRWCFAINPIIDVPTLIASGTILRKLKAPGTSTRKLLDETHEARLAGTYCPFPKHHMSFIGHTVGWYPFLLVISTYHHSFGSLGLADRSVPSYSVEEERRSNAAITSASVAYCFMSTIYGFTIVAGTETLSYYVKSA
jgi:MFS family permease